MFRVSFAAAFEPGGGGETEKTILEDGGRLSLLGKEGLGCNLKRGVKLEERESFEGVED